MTQSSATTFGGQPAGKPRTFLDGAVDPARWDAEPLRVLWILREVNDPDGGWFKKIGGDLVGELRNASDPLRFQAGVRRTFLPVAQVSYGLQHPEAPWESFASRIDLCASALRTIAVVNTRKDIGGGSTSEWSRLDAAVDTSDKEDALQKQVHALRPHVVIGGNVLWLWRFMLEGWDPPSLPRLRGKEPVYAWRAIGGTTWIHAHHPAHRGDRWTYYHRIRAAFDAATQARSAPRG